MCPASGVGSEQRRAVGCAGRAVAQEKKACQAASIVGRPPEDPRDVGDISELLMSQALEAPGCLVAVNTVVTGLLKGLSLSLPPALPCDTVRAMP